MQGPQAPVAPGLPGLQRRCGGVSRVARHQVPTVLLQPRGWKGEQVLGGNGWKKTLSGGKVSHEDAQTLSY